MNYVYAELQKGCAKLVLTMRQLLEIRSLVGEQGDS